MPGGTKIQFDNGVKLTGKEIGLRYSSHSDLVKAMDQVANNEFGTYLPMVERAQKNSVSTLYY